MPKPKVEVETLSEGQFCVRVIEGGSHSSHQVTLTSEDCRRLASGKASPEELIRRSFEFLLEHEAKESILPRFDLPAIGRYFPEYENEIKRRF